MRFSLRRSAASRRSPGARPWFLRNGANLRLETLEDRMLPTFTVTVTNNTDGDPGSLRDAINQVNTSGAGDALIKFQISGGAAHIQPVTPLPQIIIPTVVDGTTQPGYVLGGPPAVFLDGSLTFGNGLSLIGGNSTVKGLTVGNFSGNGISLSLAGNDIIKQCFIGTDTTGTTTASNNNGIDIEFGADNNTIGSDIPAERNVISGNNFYGIYDSFSNNNIIKGNYIGTDLTGTVAVPNLNGVLIATGTGNTIGGSINNGATVQANVIAGNNGDGIDLSFAANNNVIKGNYIGLETGGTVALGNKVDGISVSIGSNGNTIGGLETGGTANVDTNYIAGNQRYGINISTGDANKILGNWIGTTLGGTAALTSYANGLAGILLSASTNTQVGGTTQVAGNLISNNHFDGLDIASGSGNIVEGNLIGTDATGQAALPNNQNGITISGGAINTVIGGTVLIGTVNVSGNLIAGNKMSGIYIQDATTKTLVEGNLIGNYTDPMKGTVALPNGTNGVTLFDGPQDNTIGGTVLNGTIHNARNIISGNKGFGILMAHESLTTGNTVLDNYIGTDITGTLAVPNLEGVGISDGAVGNIIGARLTNKTDGSDPYEAVPNLIAYNTRYGIGMFGQGTSNNVAIDNYIGELPGNTAATTVAEPNGDGVFLYDGATGNYIGQTAVATDQSTGKKFPYFHLNHIAGNTNAGVHFGGPDTAGNVVQNNLIGVFIDPQNSKVTHALPNGQGVEFSEGAGGTDFATANVVGTMTTVPAGQDIYPSPNVISGNTNYGVGFHDVNTAYNIVQGNYIGTDVTGTMALGSTEPSQPYGVVIYDGASFNQIGGTAANANAPTVNLSRNIISANAGDGVFIEGTFFGAYTTHDNIVEGNYIGTDLNGTVALANGGNGITIFHKALKTVIGGTTVAGTVNVSGNLISGNPGDAINISDQSTGTVILGNYIGVDHTGTVALTNGLVGVHVVDTNDHPNNTAIGDGTSAGTNTIWYTDPNTGGDAILIDTAIDTSVRGNSIAYHDPNLGIDLVNGANNQFAGGAILPTITSVTINTATGDIFITYTFTDPNWVMQPVFFDFYASEVCNASGFGEGRVFLGPEIVDMTDASGFANNNGLTLDLKIPAGSGVTSGWFVTANATEEDLTDPKNPLLNSSQFSQCFTVPGPASGVPSVGALPLPAQPVAPLQPPSLQPLSLVPFAQPSPDLSLGDPGQAATPQQGRDLVFAHFQQHLGGLDLPDLMSVLEANATLSGHL